MKHAKKFFAIFLTALLLVGCGQTSEEEQGLTPSTDPLLKEADMFTDNDFKTSYDTKKCITIQLNGDAISCDSKSVAVSGTTISIQKEGTYLISGTLNNGMIMIDTDENAKPHLIFDNVSVTNLTSAPFYILNAEKVFVTLTKNSKNTLTSGDSFTVIDENKMDGTIFSKQDLTFNGSGALTVNAPSGHGIVCKDDLVFTGGTYTIQSASHGIDANDSIRITKASLTITSGKDGCHVENTEDESKGFFFTKDGTLTITSEGDGISSSSVTQIHDGTFEILTGGGHENATKKTSDRWGGFPGGGMGGTRPGRFEKFPQQHPPTTPTPNSKDETSTDTSTSIKGIKSSDACIIYGGSFKIDSADDSIHSNKAIAVNNGTFQIASGDDAFHADDSLTILDGNIDISTSYEGLEAAHVSVQGGKIKLIAKDDGINAAGGMDDSGNAGPREQDQFTRGSGGFGGSSNGSITIAGGTIYLQASGDGVDANGTLEISGGHTTVVGPTHGDTAVLDYDKSGSITGGTFVGTGAANMAQTLGSSDQGVIFLKVENQAAETKLVLKDSNGKEILSCEPELDYQLIVLSSPDIKKGETYMLNIGESSRKITAN